MLNIQFVHTHTHTHSPSHVRKADGSISTYVSGCLCSNSCWIFIRLIIGAQFPKVCGPWNHLKVLIKMHIPGSYFRPMELAFLEEGSKAFYSWGF